MPFLLQWISNPSGCKLASLLLISSLENSELFFPLFSTHQLLRAETQDTEGMLMSVLNSLTVKKNMCWSVCEERWCKARHFDSVLGDHPGLLQRLDPKLWAEVICYKLLQQEWRSMLPGQQAMAWSLGADEIEGILWTSGQSRGSSSCPGWSLLGSHSVDQNHLWQMPLDDFP